MNRCWLHWHVRIDLCMCVCVHVCLFLSIACPSVNSFQLTYCILYSIGALTLFILISVSENTVPVTRAPIGTPLYVCYHHTTHSTSLEARVWSGHWIAAHLWLVLQGDWGWRLSTGIGDSCGWNSAIEHRSRVRAQSLVLFPRSPCPELWTHNI